MAILGRRATAVSAAQAARSGIERSSGARVVRRLQTFGEAHLRAGVRGEPRGEPSRGRVARQGGGPVTGAAARACERVRADARERTGNARRPPRPQGGGRANGRRSGPGISSSLNPAARSRSWRGGCKPRRKSGSVARGAGGSSAAPSCDRGRQRSTESGCRSLSRKAQGVCSERRSLQQRAACGLRPKTAAEAVAAKNRGTRR